MGTTYTAGWVDGNAAPGEIQVPIGQSIFEESSTQNAALGHRVSLTDGRVFRYSYFVTATNAALLVANDTSENDVAETDNAILAPASCVTTTDNTSGDNHIELTLASALVNQYAGGHIIISDGTGAPNIYRIESSTATNDPATGNIRLTLKDKLRASLDATSDFAIMGHPYANLHGATAATDPVVRGVTMRAMTVDYFGWAQTWGIACVLADASTSAGTLGDGFATLSDGVTGAFQLMDAYTEDFVGTVLFEPDDTTYGAVNLKISW